MPEGVEGKLVQMETLIQETAELARENNKILKSMQRMDRIGMWVKAILWIAVLVLPFLLIGPILEMLVPAAGGVPTNLFGVPSPEQLLETYQQFQQQSQGL